MKMTVGVIFAVISVSTAIAPAQATLISMDDSGFGTGAITLDTTTGLEWLDLTKSTDLSFNFVSSQLGLGGQFYGFRYATNSEIGSLWTNAGIVITQTINNQNIGDPANIAPIEALQAFIGVTYSLTDYTTQGISGTINPSITYPHDLPYLVRSIGLTAPLCCEDNIGSWGGDEHNPGVGSWLVHGEPPAFSSAPEPATLAILAFGLAGLGYCKRKQLQSIISSSPLQRR